MGANASSYPQSCPPHFGQQTFGTPLYTQQSSSWESKLYSLEPSGPERLHDRAKKRISGLATLKRRFIMRRKAGRSADHTRQMRELLAGWDAREVGALVEEYEGTAALKELSSAAALARPDAASLRRDMAALFQHKHCTDVDLVFQDTCFPAHRAILAARCPFFKTLLSSAASATSGCGGTEVLLDVGTAGMDVTMFSALLHFLYTGKLGTGTAGKDGEPEIQARTVEVLRQLSEEFGMPNPLEVDMRALYNYMCYYDSVLSFCSDPEAAESSGRLSGISGGGITGAAGAFAHADHPHSHGEDLRAHKAVLSARSPFFRNLLQRRIRTGEEMTERALQAPTLIVLDESIIPRKYARVILHCMYTDTVELSLVMRGSPSVGSLSEGQGFLTSSSSTRGAIPTHTEEAMELYHIALFLEFTMLAQGCEDIVAESISLDSLAAILKWSSQPYGSKWVHRQAMHFLCEEFSQVMTSDIFYELTKEHLLAAVQSDYLQASEQDILKYVIKWGEQQLIRRMAEREPNLLSGTAHSVQKRGVKRRDLDLEELREILSPLLPYVRIEHILPASGDVLADAMKRGLVSTPPSDMLPTAGGGKASVWLRLKNAGIYVRPRLFSPYVDEARSILEEMMVEQSDLVRLRMVRISNVPDTLYMVTNTVPQRCHLVNHQPITGSQSAAPSVVANEIPVPQLGVVRQMIGRLQELRLAEHVQRAYALNCGEGATVSSELQLRVLREFGLPDGAAELLQNPHKFFPEEHFGDKSPLLNLRPSGRCRVNSSPAVDSMLTDLDGFGVVHPPLPPLPPPYHPPATPGRGHLRGAWRRRVLVQPPSRSLSYPCNYTLLQGQTLSAAKHSSPAYGHSDCRGARALSVGRAALPETHGTFEPLRRDFMPDIAIGMSALALSGDEGSDVPPRPHQNVTSSVPNCTAGPGPAARHCHSQTTCMRHLSIPNEPHPDFPDLYSQTFSNRLDGPAPGRPLQTSHKGPDIYSHARTAPSAHPSDPTHPASQGDGAASPAEPSYLEQRSDAVQASVGPSAGNAHPLGRCVDPDSALTCGLGASRHGAGGGGVGGGVGKESSGGTAHLRTSTGDETTANQDQPSPSTDYQHRKCAL